MVQNPMLMGGLGLLAGNQQGNPFGGLLSGVQAAQGQVDRVEQKKRDKQMREFFEEWAKRQKEIQKQYASQNLQIPNDPNVPFHLRNPWMTGSPQGTPGFSWFIPRQ